MQITGQLSDDIEDGKRYVSIAWSELACNLANLRALSQMTKASMRFGPDVRLRLSPLPNCEQAARPYRASARALRLAPGCARCPHFILVVLLCFLFVVLRFTDELSVHPLNQVSGPLANAS